MHFHENAVMGRLDIDIDRDWPSSVDSHEDALYQSATVIVDNASYALEWG